jgi:hypothetical protein
VRWMPSVAQMVSNCQATIRFAHQRQLEIPMAKPHDLGLVTG